MVGHLKRSRNVGSEPVVHIHNLLLSDGCSAQTKAAVCLSDNSSLTNIAECSDAYKCRTVLTQSKCLQREAAKNWTGELQTMCKHKCDRMF